MSNQKLLEQASARLTELNSTFKKACEEKKMAETLVVDSEHSIKMSTLILEGHQRNLHKGKLSILSLENKMGELEREIARAEKSVKRLSLMEAAAAASREAAELEKQLKEFE
jgi:hypothetical protein